MSSGKTDKYEYLTSEEILPSDKIRTIDQINFTYSALSKNFKKKTKTIEEQGKKQAKALEVLKPITQKLTIKDATLGNVVNKEARHELNKIKEKFS